MLAVQALAAHSDFLRRVAKGCLLSRKVRVLKTLTELKNVAHRCKSFSATQTVQTPSEVILTRGILM